MDEGAVEDIWEDLHAVVGDSLRGITMYEGIDQVSRLREDIRERFSEDVSRRMADENLVDQFSEERLQEAIHAGPLTAVVRLYEELVLIAWSPEGEHHRGVLAAYDRPTDRAGKLLTFEVVEYLDSLDSSAFE